MTGKRLQTGVFLLIVMMLLCAGHHSAYCDESFQVRRIGNIHPYEKNSFEVISEQEGTLTISIHDNICVYRTITQTIGKGKTVIEWDGCGYNKERLYEKTYTVTAELITENGQEHTISFQSPIEYAGQYIQYVLPSSDCIYLDSADEWFLEYRTVKNGTVVISLQSEEDENRTYLYSQAVTGGKIYRKTFDSIMGKKVPETGAYSVSVYEKSRPDDITQFRIDIQKEKPAQPVVAVTGEIMPDSSATADELWDMMMKPSVVVDIDFFKHQDIYSEPDSKSRSLGTVHGQTQGLKVISIDGDWAQVGAWNHEEAEYVEGWVPLKKLKVEYPQGEYAILIDKKAQTLTVFHQGKPVDTLLVSTGRAEKNSFYQETSAGCFLTGYHRVNFSTNGKKYDYVIQYDGGNLLHQTPYDWGQQKKDFTLGRAYLGAKASHACIRIQPEPGEGGLNAYWIYSNIPYHTRVMILDDPDERKAAINKLKRGNGKPDYSLIRTDQDESVTADQDTVTITFGGSFTPGGNRKVNARKDSFASYITTEGYVKPFDGLMRYFASDDLTCVSLGCYMGNAVEDREEWNNINYGPGEIGELLKNASIDLVQMTDDRLFANDEAFLEETKNVISGCAGSMDRNSPETITIKGHLFGFAGCSESEYIADPSVIDERISILKEQKCEKIIFLISRKEDQALSHSIVQEAMAHRCVRAGADLVIGNQPVHVQGIEYIQDVPAIYSTGCLLDGSASSISKAAQGILVQAVFEFDERNADSLKLKIIPIIPSGNVSEGKNDYCPIECPSVSSAHKIMESIWYDSTNEAMAKTAFHILNQ